MVGIMSAHVCSCIYYMNAHMCGGHIWKPLVMQRTSLSLFPCRHVLLGRLSQLSLANQLLGYFLTP